MRSHRHTATSSPAAAPLGILALALLLAGAVALAEPAPPPLAGAPGRSAPAGPVDDGSVSPATACAGLCNAFYKAAPEDRALCIEGCDGAAKCTDQCSQRHENREDRERCHYRCARAR